MGRMIFELTDEDREALERIRIELGCRSHAETLRQLIRSRSTPVKDCESIAFEPKPAVPVLQRKAFNPQPKTTRKR